ncbi:arylsulfatase [Stieleria varia]|uniref:Arylsulfatase n=1 Tax=Stieleria varia TaxID=2528005 RepID=A0A5C6AVT4_9BACT|nr:arylsulfatase [Stieleria varia]TWU02244.1 Arylsulfatase [Stieleria varia]
MFRSCRTLLFAFLVGIAYAAQAAQPPNVQTPNIQATNIQPPNVIYILADDAGIGDFGCYGGNIISTPNVDRLALEGMRFTQHYSGSTVCAPSRSVLMTGQHTGHTRVRGNAKNPGLLKEDFTVAELMKSAGYVTGCIGKWGLGMEDSTGAPWRQGFDHFFGYLSQTNAHHYYPDFLWRDGRQQKFIENSTQRKHYSHDLFTEDALSFITVNHRQPFFLYLPYTIPHVDLDVPEDSRANYLGRLGPETPYGTPGGQHYRHEPNPHATFAGMITRMDRDIGRIMQLLGQLGVDDNTLVMFASDNGATSAGGADPEFFDSNGPYRGIKRDLYEGGIITPMIARWPGMIEAGSTTDHVSGFQDLLPTLADLVDVAPPMNIDGISFLPTLKGHPVNQKQHDVMYWEFSEQGGKRAMRKGDWKVVQLKVSTTKPKPVELYNLVEDPYETTDLAESMPERVKELTSLMDAQRTANENFPLFHSEKQ